MLDPRLLAFVGVAALFTITPGADTLLVVRNVLARGPRAGLLTTIGICCGLFVHATLSGLGLSVLLVQSATLFELVKLAGAAYIVWLGAQSLWGASRRRESSPLAVAAGPTRPERVGGWRSLREGLLSNVLNPKVAVFYLAFLPQYINPGDPALPKSILLAGIHFLLGIIWLSLLTGFLSRPGKLLSRPRVQRGLATATGGLLILLGLRLAVERR